MWCDKKKSGEKLKEKTEEKQEEKFYDVKVPKGYVIDEEKSSFTRIVFRKDVSWAERARTVREVTGYYIDESAMIIKQNSPLLFKEDTYNVFATEKQALCSKAMSQISQILLHDKRFGGAISPAEWDKANAIIVRGCDGPEISSASIYQFLIFKNKKYAALFLKEYPELVKQYLMM